MDIGASYDAYWRSSGYAGNTRLPSALREILERFVGVDDRVVDIGSGDGGTTGEWLSKKAASYVGVDVSRAAVQAARERGLDAKLIEDASSLPFEDAAFDSAVCVEVLEHLIDPAAAVNEMSRVLRPGGIAIATVPNIAHWRMRMDLALFGRWVGRGDARSASAPWLDPHIRFFTVKTLAGLFDASGLEVVETGGYSDIATMMLVPGLRRFVRDPRPGRVTMAASRLLPRVAATRAYVVGSRAADRSSSGSKSRMMSTT